MASTQQQQQQSQQARVNEAGKASTAGSQLATMQNDEQAMQQYPLNDPYFGNLADALFPFSSSLMPPAFRALLGSPFQGGQWGQQALDQVKTDGLLKLDVKESDKEYEVRADVPGVAKENVKVEVDRHNRLHISIDAKKESEDKGTRDGWTYHRVERSSTYGQRTLRLPKNADAERISASVTNGVLTLSIPKAPGTEHGRKRITVA